MCKRAYFFLGLGQLTDNIIKKLWYGTKQRVLKRRNTNGQKIFLKCSTSMTEKVAQQLRILAALGTDSG